MDDFIRDILPALIVISAITFVVAQGTICIAMPQQWFAGLVSGLMFAVCVWLQYKSRK